VSRQVERVTGGRVVTPGGTRRGTVTVVDGRIGAVEGSTATDGGPATLDAAGRLVLPGLVDLHGDELEGYRRPRPRAEVPVERAFPACERANLAAGITTKFHAVGFEADGDGRSPETARAVADHVTDASGLIDHRLHARCELTDPESVAAVRAAVEDLSPGLVSLMHHSPAPDGGQFGSEAAFEERYPDTAGTDTWARRLGASDEQLHARRESLVRSWSAPDRTVALHDATDPEAVERFADAGGDLCEFPTTLPAARRAVDRGLGVTMGAPNVVRGGSLWGNLDARTAAAAGLVDALCADYRPMALLESVFVDSGEPLDERVRRVSAGPATLVGLGDRGRIEPGRRADLIVVDPGPPPTVEAVVVAGELVYQVG
jgi:alpha-D-ribose 1-methylphosphonate 5-triphosphate diphosphatase